MNRKDRQIVQKIIKHISATLEYSANCTFDEFNSNAMLHEACIFNMLQIGELSNHLSTDFQEKNNDIPWRLMIGLRNRLAHDYDGIRLMVVWETITSDYEPLRQKLIDLVD